MPRRRGGGTAPPGIGAPSATIPENVGYALGYRAPKMAFHESRQASQYVEDLKSVLELTVRTASFTRVLLVVTIVFSIAVGRRYPCPQRTTFLPWEERLFPGTWLRLLRCMWALCLETPYRIQQM